MGHLRPARFADLEPLRKQTLLVPRPRFQQLLPRPELVTARLDDPALVRPQRIADDFAMSVRALHALFEDTDDTIAAYVRWRRPQRARTKLTRPPWPTVTDVAHRWGLQRRGELQPGVPVTVRRHRAACDAAP